MATKDNTINIKAVPVKGQIGVTKFYNNDWTTEAFLIPRSCILSKLTEEELLYNGIYFLFGYKEGIEKVYVGQGKKRNSGESLLKRLREHDTSTDEPYRDKWEYAVAVTGLNNSWTEGQVSTLERVFYNMIPKERLLNDKVPRGDLSIDCEEKIRQVSAFLIVDCNSRSVFDYLLCVEKFIINDGIESGACVYALFFISCKATWFQNIKGYKMFC